MIERDGALSVVRQCAVLGVARSSVYYRPVEDSEELELMTQIDRIFTAHPMYGSRRIQVVLGREGTQVGRRRVRRLMGRLGLNAVRPRPATSRPHPAHRVYPYLLRDLKIKRPNQVWASGVALVEYAHARVLRGGAGRGLAALRLTGDLQHRSGQSIHVRSIYRSTQAPRRAYQHGRARALPRQHLRGTPVVDRQA